MKHNSSALFYFKYYILCTKRTNQSKRFENFECSGQNFHNFCHFWNNKSVFLWILRQSSELQDKSSILFSWNFIHFQQKETITSNYKFGENFMWAVKSLKFCILMGSKNWLLVSNMTWRVWWIFTQPLKSLKICFRWVLFAQSIQGLSYKNTEELSFITLNSDEKFEWTCGFKNGMGNWVNVHYSTQKS